jgi:hypothetical protein
MNDRNDAEELPLGRCPTDEKGEFAWRLEFRRRILRMRACTADGNPFEVVPRAKEKLTGGMCVEDIWGFCPPEEFEGFDEWLREFRAQWDHPKELL